MSNILPDYDTSNVVGVSWKAEYAYPTGASGLSSTYLAEFECWLLFSFCCVNFKFLRVEFRLCHCYLDLVLVSGFWDWLSLESRFFMTSLDSIYIFNYISLSKDRKMSLWPWYLTIDIENKHSYNLNDQYLQVWLKSIEKHKLCCVNKAVKKIQNITGTLAFWPMTLKIR